jgi:hypothetical protein
VQDLVCDEAVGERPRHRQRDAAHAAVGLAVAERGLHPAAAAAGRGGHDQRERVVALQADAGVAQRGRQQRRIGQAALAGRPRLVDRQRLWMNLPTKSCVPPLPSA